MTDYNGNKPGANGNGHSNGNGHQKVFELTRVKSPEELANESARKIAPEIRTSVNFSRLPMAAKGFFSALLDLSFLHCYGGNGRGKIFITIRDLSRILKHDKDSITQWRDTLICEKLIWFREGWPRSEWRICALCPPPETEIQFSEEVFVAGKAASLGGSGNLPPATFAAPEHDSPSETEEIGGVEPKPSASLSDTSGQTVRNLPHSEGSPSPGSVRNLPHSEGSPSATVSGAMGLDGGKVSDTRGDSTGPNKETTKENGSMGAKGSVPGPSPTPRLPTFEALDGKMYPRLRRKNGEQMVERLKEKIFALENSRKPVPNKREVILAYRARIREVRDWMDGIQEPKPQ